MKNQKGTSHSGQINRLKRLSGQVNGVIKMIEDERYCIDILTQIKAIKSALGTVEKQIVEEHLSHCVMEAVNSSSKPKAKEMVEEITRMLNSSVGGK